MCVPWHTRRLCRTRLSHKRALGTCILLLVGCSRDDTPTDPSAPASAPPAFLIRDGVHSGGLRGFYWILPTLTKLKFREIPDQNIVGLDPTVTIMVCTTDLCPETEDTVARLSRITTPAVTLKSGHYQVSWITRDLPPGTYRIDVEAGATGFRRHLGQADVKLSSSGKTNLPGQQIGWKLGNPFPIEFRIETRITGSATIAPTAATVSPGGSQQFTATLRDLHGALLGGQIVGWQTFSPPPSGATASVTPANGPTNAGGQAVATVTLGATPGIVLVHAISNDQQSPVNRVVATATLNVQSPIQHSVSAGTFHTCEVTTTGTAYCWGSNGLGRLGSPGLNSSVPRAVSGGFTFTAIAGGGSHSCALTTSDAAYCWGRDLDGELGDGTNNNTVLPVAVAGGIAFASISTGSAHTCGVTAAGAAYCWGANTFGQLGNGTITSSNVPVAVSGGLTFALVSVGNAHTCGVTTADLAYCWGNNDFRQIGDGTSTNRHAPVPVAGGLTFATISAASHHSCGLTTSGAAYCWGENLSGRLGDGTNTNSGTPVAVTGGLTFAALSATGDHSCGLVGGGTAYCWGSNVEGTLGDGTNVDRSQPTPVSGSHSFASISAGGAHTCGVTTSGPVYCWGNNLSGQLGNGTTTSSNVPVAVSPPSS